MDIGHIIKKKNHEQIVHVMRRHPITFLSSIFLFLVLLSIPVFLYFLTNKLFPTLLTGSDVVLATVVVLGTIYYLSVYLFFYTQFVDYYLDIWIVTNDRIIDIEQQGIFSRVITELELFQIQDVTTHVQGFMGTLFNYGDVIVKTASDNMNIVFREVPHPHKVRGEIIRLAHEDRKFHHLSPGTFEAR